MDRDTIERINNKKMELWEKIGDINILIVDDDSFSRLLVESLLSKIPQFNFFEAGDGAEALGVISDNHIDIILLDLRMPKMNGYEMLKAIKGDPKHRDIPILVISIDDGDREMLYDEGIDGFIYKPFKLEELRSKIYKALTDR
jgi:CheY-like chemotaxis protein